MVILEPGGAALGLVLLIAFMVIAVVGFMLIGRALIKVTDRLFSARGGALEELRRRYAGGEIDAQEFEARRRQLAAH